MHYSRESQFGPYWSITKFSDIMYVDTHHQIFSSENSQGGITLGGRPLAEGETPDPTYDLPMFIMSDPPKHDLQRGVVAPVFLPRQIAALESLIRERAGTILDNLPRNEEFNWVRHVSVELTGQMLATLFDIPLEDRQKLIYWSDATSNLGNPEYFATVEEGFKVLWECAAYFMALFEQRKNEPPKSDLISVLAHGESTKNMPPNEFLGNILLLIVGGNDTTRNSISRRIARAESESGGIRQAARESVADHEHGARDHPLAVAGSAHGAHRAGRYRNRRQVDQGGRTGGDVVHLGQSRRAK